MRRDLFCWPKTGAVCVTNAADVCSSTGSRGDNLENKPQAYGGHTCLWLLGETVVNVDCLVVCRAPPGGRTPTYDIHCPFSGMRVTRVTGYFPQYIKTSHGHQHSNKISPAQWGSFAGLETSIMFPSAIRRKQRKRGGQRRKMIKQTGCPRGNSEYACGVVQVPTDEALSWKRLSTTLVRYAYKKQGYAQIGH